MTQAHVIPLFDLVVHESDEDCICFPTPYFVPGGTVYTHHSLDGRELKEKS